MKIIDKFFEFCIVLHFVGNCEIDVISMCHVPLSVSLAVSHVCNQYVPSMKSVCVNIAISMQTLASLLPALT